MCFGAVCSIRYLTVFKLVSAHRSIVQNVSRKKPHLIQIGLTMRGQMYSKHLPKVLCVSVASDSQILLLYFLVDASVTTLYNPRSRQFPSASHIRHLIPNAKIIVIVCDPVKR